MPDALLEVGRLEVRYGSVPAVRDLSFAVGEREIVGLIGPNGAGKTTTLHAVMGLIPAHGGEVRLAGRPLRGLRPEAIARLGLALVPEGRRIYPDFTVDENLRLGLVGRGDRRDAERDLAWIRELFPLVHDFRDRQAGALSGGQQQQLAIARALAAGPTRPPPGRAVPRARSEAGRHPLRGVGADQRPGRRRPARRAASPADGRTGRADVRAVERRPQLDALTRGRRRHRPPDRRVSSVMGRGRHFCESPSPRPTWRARPPTVAEVRTGLGKGARGGNRLFPPRERAGGERR